MAGEKDRLKKKELENIATNENDEEPELEESELEEVLDSVPPEQRKIIERMMISSVQMRSIAASPESAVMKKITPDHITKYLEGAEEEMKNSYKERFQRKVFTFLTVLIAMVFFVVIIILLKELPDIMEKVIYAGGGVIAGAFGGYGIGKNRRDD